MRLGGSWRWCWSSRLRCGWSGGGWCVVLAAVQCDREVGVSVRVRLPLLPSNFLFQLDRITSFFIIFLLLLNNLYPLVFFLLLQFTKNLFHCKTVKWTGAPTFMLGFFLGDIIDQCVCLEISAISAISANTITIEYINFFALLSASLPPPRPPPPWSCPLSPPSQW